MGFDGSGTYTLPSPEFPAVPGTIIKAADFNAILLDLAAALSLTLTRDGQALATGNLNMNAKKVTGLAAGTVPGDAVRFEQLSALLTPALTALSALTPATGKLPYFNGATTAALATTTAYGRGLLALADAAALLAAAGAEPANATILKSTAIGVTVQGYDALLAAIAGLTTAADKLIYTTGVDTVAVCGFPAQARTLLAATTAALQRTALALGGSATRNVGTVAGTVAAGDDARFTSGVDPAARDLAVFNSFLNRIDLGRASGAIPSGYMHLFLTDELATKTGASYDAAGDYYTNEPTISGTPYTITAAMCTLTGFQSSDPATLFDGSTASAGNYPATGVTAGNSHFVLGFGTPVALGKLEIFISGSNISPAMKAQYSDDGGSTWTDAGGSISTWTGSTWNPITWPASVGAHAKWRVVNTVTNPNPANWCEIRGYAYGSSGNMTLVPTAITAGSAPGTVNFYMLHKAVDATTLNTDIKARVSRDNGSNWSTHVTLAEICQYDADYKLLKGTAALSAIASGTSVKWEITTLNTKSQRVRAAAMILNS